MSTHTHAQCSAARHMPGARAHARVHVSALSSAPAPAPAPSPPPPTPPSQTKQPRQCKCATVANKTATTVQVCNHAVPRAGFIPSAFLALGVALAGRNNVLTFLLGLSHERAIWWHGLCVAAAVGTGLYHGLIEQLNVDDERCAEGVCRPVLRTYEMLRAGLGPLHVLLACGVRPGRRQARPDEE